MLKLHITKQKRLTPTQYDYIMNMKSKKEGSFYIFGYMLEFIIRFGDLEFFSSKYGKFEIPFPT